MTELEEHLSLALQDIEDKGLLRQVTPLHQLGGSRIEVAGKNYLNLSGNDYLGLATDRTLVEEFYGHIRSDTLLERFGPYIAYGAIAYIKLATRNTPYYDPETARGTWQPKFYEGLYEAKREAIERRGPANRYVNLSPWAP